MGSTALWMTAVMMSLLVAIVATLEETVRHRGACVQLQRELRSAGRRARPSTAISPRHLRAIDSTTRVEHRKVA